VGKRPKKIKSQTLQEWKIFFSFSVEGKVVKLNQVMEVSRGRKKQDLVVADSTGSSRLTIWEEGIGTVVEGKCYRFAGMLARFQGVKILVH